MQRVAVLEGISTGEQIRRALARSLTAPAPVKRRHCDAMTAVNGAWASSRLQRCDGEMRPVVTAGVALTGLVSCRSAVP